MNSYSFRRESVEIKRYGHLGTIKYDYFDGYNSGICGAFVEYERNTDSIKYSINATYQNIGALVSTIGGVLLLPAAITMGI